MIAPHDRLSILL